MKLPYVKTPCADCPFRKDTMKGWLGKERMQGILKDDGFTCHKTSGAMIKQCAGHMLIKGDDNAFVALAKRLGITLKLSGREKVFDTQQDCINHHE